MRVYVPTPEHYSPASRAMRMEAIGVEEHLCEGPLDYARFFTSAWNSERQFILVEWDVVPWPGAVAALDACDRPWCVHRYPIGRGTPLKWGPALGCGKYTPEGELPPEVATTDWRLLDGVLVPWLYERFGPPHVHEPPVAHPKDGSR